MWFILQENTEVPPCARRDILSIPDDGRDWMQRYFASVCIPSFLPAAEIHKVRRSRRDIGEMPLPRSVRPPPFVVMEKSQDGICGMRGHYIVIFIQHEGRHYRGPQ